MESEIIRFGGDVWCRFNEYEIRNGAICPVSNQQPLDYFPWEVFENTAGRTNSPPPYRQLVSLINELWSNYRFYMNDQKKRFQAEISKQISFLSPHEVKRKFSSVVNLGHDLMLGITQKDEKRLLKWCSENGLLGIFLHQASCVTTRPLWKINKDRMVAEGSRYTRYGQIWKEELIAWRPKTLKLSKELVGLPVPDEEIPEFGKPVGVVYQKSLYNPASVCVSQDKIPCFFLENLQGDAFPIPRTHDFWMVYQEPLDVFINAAIELANCVGRLGRTGGEREWGIEDLNSLKMHDSIAYVTVVKGEEGSVEEELRPFFISKSLLSAYAHMALKEDSKFKHSFLCSRPSCRTPFYTTRSHGKYCSLKCEQNDRKQRMRAKKRNLG